MKSLSPNTLLVTLGLFAFVVLGINLTYTFAQDDQIVTQNNQIDELEGKMNQFMDLLLAEKNHQVPSLEPAGDLTGEQDLASFAPPDPSVAGCMEGYTSWPTSNTFQQGPWQPYFILTTAGPGSDNDFHNFMDINGDGLIDYVYLYSYYGYGNDTRQACVMLNNGEGWEPGYKCRMNKPGNADPWTFWGDCADTGA